MEKKRENGRCESLGDDDGRIQLKSEEQTFNSN